MSVRRVFAVLMLMLRSSAASADYFVGQASVIDGDMLEIRRTRIRLSGVDAPDAASCAAAGTVRNIAAARRQQRS
jgi:endonuclease YncB( thermonuclease family)